MERCWNLVASKSVANPVNSAYTLEEGTLKLARRSPSRTEPHLIACCRPSLTPSQQDLGLGNGCQVWEEATEVLYGKWKRHNYSQVQVKADFNKKPDPAPLFPLSSLLLHRCAHVRSLSKADLDIWLSI